MLEELKGQTIVVPTHSPFNSPVWPVCKPKGKWRLTIDYCGLHANPDPLTAAAPNIAELIASVQEQAHPMRASIDVKDVVFMSPCNLRTENVLHSFVRVNGLPDFLRDIPLRWPIML